MDGKRSYLLLPSQAVCLWLFVSGISLSRFEIICLWFKVFQVTYRQAIAIHKWLMFLNKVFIFFKKFHLKQFVCRKMQKFEHSFSWHRTTEDQCRINVVRHRSTDVMLELKRKYLTIQTLNKLKGRRNTFKKYMYIRHKLCLAEFTFNRELLIITVSKIRYQRFYIKLRFLQSNVFSSEMVCAYMKMFSIWKGV